jgi:tetratricopeptide (TPR) repeat protein
MSKRSLLLAVLITEIIAQQSVEAATKSDLMLQATSAETQGEPRKAIALYQKVVAVEQKKGPDNTLAARAQLRIATIQVTEGELAAAEPAFKQAINLKSAMCEQEPELMVDMDDMAEAYMAQSKKNATAKDCMLHALALRQKIDPKHPNVAITYRYLALYALNHGDWRGAENYLKQGLELQKNCTASKLGRLLNDRALLTSIYITHDEWAKAEQLTRESLAQAQSINSATWAWPLLHFTLGRCHSQRAEYDDAGKEYELAIALAKKYPNPQCDISPEVHKAIQANMLLKQKQKTKKHAKH